jgi:3-methyladenine DNA glycosylase Tag
MKKFRRYVAEGLVSESLFSKSYAVAQNSQHNAASQKIASNANKIAAILKNAKTRNEPDEKIERLLDAMIEMTELFKNQSQQSTNIKNTVVTAALDETAKLLSRCSNKFCIFV